MALLLSTIFPFFPLHAHRRLHPSANPLVCTACFFTLTRRLGWALPCFTLLPLHPSPTHIGCSLDFAPTLYGFLPRPRPLPPFLAWFAPSIRARQLTGNFRLWLEIAHYRLYFSGCWGLRYTCPLPPAVPQWLSRQYWASMFTLSQHQLLPAAPLPLLSPTSQRPGRTLHYLRSHYTGPHSGSFSLREGERLLVVVNWACCLFARVVRASREFLVALLAPRGVVLPLC